MGDRLPPGATVGILGGGQLGRMLALAAHRLGLRPHIYDPDPDAPAAAVTRWSTACPWDDVDALRSFATEADVVTFEFENIPLAALDTIEALAPIRPGRRALEVSSDRVTEKRFLRSIGLATADFAPFETLDELALATAETGRPAILKTRRLGYDGRGQVRLGPEDDLGRAHAALSGAAAIAERVVPFGAEISVIAARGLDGEVVAFDPGENLHQAGILRRTKVPADVSEGQRQNAVLAAGRILNALDYVGVLGVEFFVTRDLIVNEIAPRVHNSGHWTSVAATIDQFEMHIRAIAGWPLGTGDRHSDAVMENLLGTEIDALPSRSGSVHHYGKSEARPGRKMGHITTISPRRR
ncbi:MAG: 5-(carboxyamino)imidazole ribonucleotide synthase [Pseudomonadota bacterium]